MNSSLLSLASIVQELMLKKGLTLSIAESCTGGLISSILTKLPECSKYFKGSIVCYSRFSKENILNINKNILEKYGTISSEVSLEMAKKTKELFDSDIGLSATGVAGPSSEENKPVGLVYISLYSDNFSKTKELNLIRTREEIQLKAAQAALNMLRLYLLK
ncbi:MAG: CinA family protein [Candidatus Humimicrobiia bacterium]